jgi:hypothetical protein
MDPECRARAIDESRPTSEESGSQRAGAAARAYTTPGETSGHRSGSLPSFRHEVPHSTRRPVGMPPIACRTRAVAQVLHFEVDMISANTNSKIALLILFAIALGSGVACHSAREPIREMTYPPDFSYLPEDRLRSSMWILAGEIHHLDELLRSAPDESNADLQQEVQRTLQRLAVAVEQIDRPGRSTQHPALNQHLGRFAHRIELAQRSADRTPPNYFQASALSGSCFLCHGPGGEAGGL